MKHWEQLKNGAPLFDQDKKVYGFENDLIYDEVQETLRLTIDAVSNELNIPLELIKKDTTNANVFLRELSQLVYSYIYKKKPAVLREKTKYILHYDMKNRKTLFLVLIDVIRYALYSGGNITGYQPGVNLNETGIIDVEDLRNERIMSYVSDSLIKTNFLVDRNFVEKFTLPEEEW